MDEFLNLPAPGRPGNFSGVSQRDQNHLLISWRHLQNVAGLVMIVQSHNNGTQAVTVGGKAKVLTGNSEIEHKPIAEYRFLFLKFLLQLLGQPFHNFDCYYTK